MSSDMFSEVKNEINNLPVSVLPKTEKDVLIKKYDLGKKNVLKCFHHAIRDFVQSKSRREEIADLGYDKICIVIDLYMKNAPQRYREKIEQWFAKCGMT